VGAYQEILGDMHNLFGDTDAVMVRIQEDGNYLIEEIDHGDSVGDVLRYVHLSPENFLKTYEHLVKSRLPESEHQAILTELKEGLEGYTYLEDFHIKK
jgi:arginine decarboxylase